VADLYINGVTTSKARSGNNTRLAATGTRDGALYTCPYVLNMALEGRVFHVSHGTVTTPITFIAYDADRPDLGIDVPTGTTIIPVRILVYLEDMAGTDNEIIVEANRNLLGASTSTALTIYNVRTDAPMATGCSAYGTYTANATAVTVASEFWRAGDPIAQAAGSPLKTFLWNLEDGTPQVLVGPASISLHVSATTTQAAGFVKASWIELPSSSI
jgi:hypothetical protein